MRSYMTLLGASLTAFGLIVSAGCGGSSPPPEPAVVNDHDHDGHDHDGHDHDGHDHDGHDHDGHDHGTTIDADAMGLSTDDLVSIDKPDLPDNYDDAVKQLVKLHEVIGDAFKADDPDAAHNPLHEMGDLLGKIESLVADGHQDAADQEELLAAVEELFASYTAVDETFHSDEGTEYSEVASKIDAAVKTLQDHIGHD